ncbi:hypothetical protein M3193_05630 [Sporosarcina luteola]|uniref:hypothetical protein n=1 Tax=Sporosarcina luteola TaxID=582850 RepID=UPI00203EFBF9|nr:hypothetical protein [Sporosarcina luteola]MCM3743615.1 hypothetical protein [Sporosarcina luteola]
MLLVLFFISACSEIGIEHFSSQEEALIYLIDKEEIKGNIDLIVTIRGERLLIVQSREDIFFVGELVEDKEGYYAEKISDSVVIGVGASWELNTASKNKYTIYFEKDKKDLNFIPFSNGEYDMSLVEGHLISKNTTDLISAIKEVKVIKE